MNTIHFQSFLALAEGESLTSEQVDQLREMVAPAPEEARPPRLLDRSEVVSLLRVSKTQLWRLGKSGRLRPLRIGARVLYDPEDIDTFLRTCKRKCKRGP
jgi:predicted DNA-binding transcriptional regulator AlpA